MGTIASSGVGSGLDVAGLVQKLVQAEGAPKAARLDTEEAKAQAKLSALGTLRSALAGFRDTLATLKKLESFRGRQATLSTPDYITATASATTAPGVYAIEVQRLAQAHKMQSGNISSSAPIGTGTLRIEIGGATYDVIIDSTNNTAAGIAAAINSAAVGEKVVATVITGVGGNSRLTISARATGAASAMTITESGGDVDFAALVSGLADVQGQGAQDASVLIDGFEATSSTNTVSGAIAGVELALLEADTVGETTTLTVGYDRDAARKTIDDFVKSYNAIVDAVNSVSSYNTETQQGGPLFGDAGVRNIVYQLRRELSATVADLSGPFDMLADLGISAGLDGKLGVDATKLDAAFTTDFDAIGELFSDVETGLAVKLDAMLDPYLQTGGVLDTRDASLKSTIDDIGERREALDKRLLALQERHTREFNALDTLLAQLQSTSNFLSQQLDKLPGVQLFNNDD